MRSYRSACEYATLGEFIVHSYLENIEWNNCLWDIVNSFLAVYVCGFLRHMCKACVCLVLCVVNGASGV